MTREQETQVFAQDYASGLTMKSIGIKYSRAASYVYKLLKENGTISRKDTGAKVLGNKAAFKSVNPSSAYWTGFLMADGCVHKGLLRLDLAVRDISHVEKFAAFLGSRHKISINKERQTVSIAFKDQELVEDLLGWGLGERKSSTLLWPEKIPEEFLPDLVRGYFDGDGSLYECKQAAKVRLNITSSPQFIEGLKNWIESKLGDGKGAVRTPGNSRQIRRYVRGGVPSCFRFLDLIYGNSECKEFLDRKMERYITYKEKYITSKIPLL